MDPRSSPEAITSGDRRSEDDLLSVSNLAVEFRTAEGVVHAVDGISYGVKRGEIVALVGESGSGKSVSALAVLRLLPRRGACVSGRVLFEGRDLLRLPEAEMRAIRGCEIAMVFQEPMTSLNPVLSIAAQVMEPLQIHLGMAAPAARRRAVELLELVGMTDPERRLDQFPHQLSGGMRQRIMIAMALACEPKLLIADEPTTALDVTIQAQILDRLHALSRRRGIAVILITHNLGIVARYADRVNVMYAGRLAEQASVARIFTAPRHFYTLGLLRSVPRLDVARAGELATIEGLPPDLREPLRGCRFAPRCMAQIAACERAEPPLEATGEHRSSCIRAEDVPAPSRRATLPLPVRRAGGSPPLLEVHDLKKYFETPSHFRGGGRVLRAVDGVGFAIAPGRTLGLVGESGCGKTTVARLILGLERATAGRVVIAGSEVTGGAWRDHGRPGRKVQMVFQDPTSSLNPRMTIGRFIAEPLLVHRIAHSRRAARARVAELLDQVGLQPHMAERYPHQLSGGQRQRAGIARALALEPSLIVCDEPVSALDVSIQGQVVNLLEALQARHALSLLFISHDLAVVRHIADDVVVMYLGRILEMAPRDAIYGNPRHPYTRALLDAVPVPDPAVERVRRPGGVTGETPSPFDPPSGCGFRTRCPIATERCARDAPALREISPGHVAACHNIDASAA